MSLIMRKPAFHICENKDADQLRGNTAKLISAFVFATRIVQPLYFINMKFLASSHLLWLYSPVCVAPGRKPRRPIFSQRGSNIAVISLGFEKIGRTVENTFRRCRQNAIQCRDLRLLLEDQSDMGLH